MDRIFLKTCLDQRMTLKAIGRLAGKHPTTVGYWVRKHRLVAVHRDKTGPQGGIEAPVLRALVDDGLSTREIARTLDVSVATVRHWLERHKLVTLRGHELVVTAEARRAGAPVVPRRCTRHGVVMHRRRRDGGYRCPRCNAEAVVRRRRRVKQILVEEAGGRCAICGYDRYAGALQFHHVDPAGKLFLVSRNGATRSIAEARSEAAKCALLCANCHAEVEAGVTPAPMAPAARVRGVSPR